MLSPHKAGATSRPQNPTPQPHPQLDVLFGNFPAPHRQRQRFILETTLRLEPTAAERSGADAPFGTPAPMEPTFCLEISSPYHLCLGALSATLGDTFSGCSRHLSPGLYSPPACKRAPKPRSQTQTHVWPPDFLMMPSPRNVTKAPIKVALVTCTGASKSSTDDLNSGNYSSP